MEPRIRSDYQIIASPIISRTFPISCANLNWSAPNVAGSFLNGTSKVMSDYVIPRFHQRRKAGERFFNDMFKEEITISEASSGIHFRNVAVSCPPSTRAESKVENGVISAMIPRAVANSRGHQFPLLVESLSASEILRAQKLVSTEVLAKIGTNSAEMWESVAEFGQTMELLKNPLRRAQELSKRLLQSASRGNASRQLLSEVSGGYLMYRYGILSAMRDIENILSSLTKEGGYKEQTSRAYERLDCHSSAPGTYLGGAYNTAWLRQSDDVVAIKGMHLDRGHVSFANSLGFDLKGLILLPLQLTSYSFVADWFSNLSSYVKATIPAFGWTAVGGCLVTTRATSTAYTLGGTTNLLPGSFTLLASPQGSSAIVRLSTTRQPLMPASFEKTSDFGFDRFSRVADAFALVASRLVKVNTLVGPQPNLSAFHNRKAYSLWANQPGVL